MGKVLLQGGERNEEAEVGGEEKQAMGWKSREGGEPWGCIEILLNSLEKQEVWAPPYHLAGKHCMQLPKSAC